MIHVPVYRRGDLVAFALVDRVREPDVSAIRWTLDRSGYVSGTVDGRRTSLHRFVAKCDPGTGQVVHHRNHNKLDNRRSNLVVCADHMAHGEAEELERIVIWRPRAVAA